MNIIRMFALLVLVLSPATVQAQQGMFFELGDGVWVARENTENPTEHDASVLCAPDDFTLCLRDGWFTVRFYLDWDLPDLREGHVIRNPLRDSYGAFWIYGDDNPEVSLKVLDGCGINGKFWVFAGGMTERSFLLYIKDGFGNVSWYAKLSGYVVAVRETDTNFPCPRH